MKFIAILSALFLFLPQKNVVNISLQAYRQTLPAEQFAIDKKVVKKGQKITYSTHCKPLTDSQDADNPYEHTYIGDIRYNATYKLIKKEYNNEEEYLIINDKTCRVTRFRGRPFKFKQLIVCADGTMDTDKSPAIQVWKIDSAGVHRVKSIAIEHEKDPMDIRIDRSGHIVFLDHQQKAWRLTDLL